MVPDAAKFNGQMLGACAHRSADHVCTLGLSQKQRTPETGSAPMDMKVPFSHLTFRLDALVAKVDKKFYVQPS